MSGSTLPLELVGVDVRVGPHLLLDSIDAVLERGAKSVILGPNGAGKTLLLRVCHGLLAPTRGQVRFGGGSDPDRARARQAMLFQRPALLRRSALANVRWALALRGAPRSERTARAREALEAAGLLRLAERGARVLSGGEQQRLALARIWALAPEVAFLDEPTASLDPAAARAVEALVEKLHAGGTKVVLTTQDLAQARRLADEVLFLQRGRLLEQTPAERFFAEPRSDEARRFLRGELAG
jgi:tungstate transport system ATP-binding protein